MTAFVSQPKHNFKEGDHVRMMKACSGLKSGEETYLIKGRHDDGGPVLLAFSESRKDSQRQGCTCRNYWEKIEHDFSQIGVKFKF